MSIDSVTLNDQPLDLEIESTNEQTASWNGRDLTLIEPESQDTHPQEPWAVVQNLVKFYVQNNSLPKKTLVSASSPITCTISLSELLSLDYQSLNNPPIPFFLPIELPNPPPGFGLPPLIPPQLILDLIPCQPPELPTLEIPQNIAGQSLTTPSTSLIDQQIANPNFSTNSLQLHETKSWIANFLEITGQGIKPNPYSPEFTSSQPFTATDLPPTDWHQKILNTMQQGIAKPAPQPPTPTEPPTPITPQYGHQYFRSHKAKKHQPIPIAKAPDPEPTTHKNPLLNFLEIVGRSMIDQDLQDPHVPLPTAELSFSYQTEGVKSPNCRLMGVNGMNTSPEMMKSHAAYLNQFVPNQSIDWVYNRTHGPLLDLTEIFSLNYAGYSPNTSGLLTENWTQFHQANHSNPNAKLLQFCHSQGAIHVKNALLNAPEEIRNRVIVVAIAPALVIPDEMCFKSFNYASKKDIVHYGELVFAAVGDAKRLGLTNSLSTVLENRNQLVLLDPHPDATGIDHDWQSPTFEDIIGKHIKEYVNKNGEYK